MRCVYVDAGGVVRSAGVAEQCLDTQFVLVTSEQYKNLALSPFNLSAEDGAAVSAAIAVVWGAAFGIRAVIKTLHGAVNHENDE